MKKLQQLKASKKKGFTLVELIVVIVIIAILAAALVTSLVGYINRARQTNALVEANNTYVATQAYISENNPTKAEDGTITVDEKLIAQVNDYLGLAADNDKAVAIADITALTVDDNYTIVAFTYEASNDQVVTYTAADGWNAAS